ncbi:hypothetical protein HYW20_01505 [Candidatus Woesearchaeota archaeon]|nr:hypothetical protein [Candidatus Woesearchaeota archaeon]
MINKKAFEIQFNWIFVLAAGAAILLFFTIVVVKQKGLAETSTKASVLKSIEAIVAGAGVGTDTTNTIQMPDSAIEIGCNRISIGGVSKQYQSMVMFAPDLIKGSKLVTQTLGFSVPYRATNMLYLTGQQARYILIGDNNLAKEINKTLPSILTKEFHKTSSLISNKNNYKVRLIIFGDIDANSIGMGSLDKMPDSDVTAIKVNGDDQKGAIQFYQKDGSAWSLKGGSIYIGRSSLIGAVYADTVESYECNMQNAFSRLNLVTKIYKGRTEVLRDSDLTERPRCIDTYNGALTQLNKIYAASSNFNNINVETISEAAKELSNQNKNAQKYSCTMIY